MSLTPGAKLGPYEILAPLGAGGMGEVYKAKDTRLERTVAIKVLPSHLSDNAQVKERFEREARAVSSLNHPHICTLHDIGSENGIDFMVMEHIEGDTLADRLTKGALPLDQALQYGTQVADALDKAHRQGVVHRDLKPGNIMLTKSGAKLLDFGLAKLAGPEVGAAESALPTQQRSLTAEGSILGTFQYMAPEQLEGKEADARTDIFAFGAVLYEMVTGRKAFEGKSQASLISAIMKDEPQPISQLQSMSPPALDHVVKTCLAKEADKRWQSAGDVERELNWIAEVGSESGVSMPVGARPRSRDLAWGLSLLLAVVVTGVAVWQVTRPAETPRPVVRSSLPLPSGVTLTGTGRHAVALSSDGTRLVYSANQQLYLRAMDQTEATPIRGTENARGPFFSPDGEWVGFSSEGQLKKVAISGGASVRLCDAGSFGGGLDARWGADDTIVFGQLGAGIMQVSADGGTPEVLIPLDTTEEVGHGPQVLPGEKAVLFTLGSYSGWDDAQVVVHSLETGERKVLIESGKDARYVPTGHVVYVFDGTLLAVPFDVDKLEVTGGPIPMAEGVMTAPALATAQFSVSDTGALVYVTGSALAVRTVVWVDRDGREEALAAEPRAYVYPRISPDGGRLAVFLPDQENDIWIWDFAHETLTRLTFAPGADLNPVWTPDGRQVAFASDRDGTPNLYLKAADGTGAVERLTESENQQYPYAFTPDGRQLVFLEMDGRNYDLVVLSLEGSPEPLLATEFSERNGEISPDGLWLAYESNASGQYEIYVRPFPNVEDGQWLISRGGGARPLWAPDGRELFYLAPGRRLMAVGVQTEPSFAPGAAEEVFGGYYAPGGGAVARTYDISPDGERFLMIKESGSDETSSTEFILVLNWFEELKRLVPTN